MSENGLAAILHDNDELRRRITAGNQQCRGLERRLVQVLDELAEAQDELQALRERVQELTANAEVC